MNLGRIPAKTALLDPGREALIDIPNDRRMTFGTLDERIRRLANGFCRRGFAGNFAGYIGPLYREGTTKRVLRVYKTGDAGPRFW